MFTFVIIIFLLCLFWQCFYCLNESTKVQQLLWFTCGSISLIILLSCLYKIDKIIFNSL